MERWGKKQEDRQHQENGYYLSRAWQNKHTVLLLTRHETNETNENATVQIIFKQKDDIIQTVSCPDSIKNLFKNIYGIDREE